MSARINSQHLGRTAGMCCTRCIAHLRPSASPTECVARQQANSQAATHAPIAHAPSYKAAKISRSVQAHSSQQVESGVTKVLTAVTNLFPVWVVLGCLSGLFFPEMYISWYNPLYVTTFLGITMLCMGFTLSVDDIASVLKKPYLVSVGAILQYTIMPTLGFLLSMLPGLATPFRAGIILVACCPGGTASNIISYLARADVGLSVMMTTASTLAAVVMTPLLTTQLIGTVVPVDGFALFKSTLQVVLAPVLSGIALNHFFPRAVARIRPYAPTVAVFMVALTVATVMAQSAVAVRQAGWFLLLVCCCLHLGGFTIGYIVSRVLKLQETTCRTNSIEVGMQNSTLGASLALMHFADPLTAAPCAVSACMHSVIGSLLAAYWQRTDPGGAPEDEVKAMEGDVSSVGA